MNPDSPEAQRQLKFEHARERLQRLAWLLDDSFKLPGTQRRFGLDPIIGLIPGIGDLVGAGLSLYLMGEAARLGAPRALLMRMAGNVLLEATVGVIPVLGDVFDFYWKANSRNLQLLTGHIDSQLKPPEAQGTILNMLILVIVVALLVFLLFKLQVPEL